MPNKIKSKITASRKTPKYGTRKNDTMEKIINKIPQVIRIVNCFEFLLVSGVVNHSIFSLFFNELD